MWTNIGGKIKLAAQINAWVGIIASVVLGIIVANSIGGDWGVLIGFFIMAVGSVFSWIGAWAIYGFGELIETNAEIAKNTANSTSAALYKTCSKCRKTYSGNSCPECGFRPATPPTNTTATICKNCGKQLPANANYCTGCNQSPK
jgi:RNA polymerase subunit RPABC4/transcription elongation factor Spt4